MPSAVKIEKVAKLKERLSDAQATVFADFRGLSVSDANELRAELAEAEAGFAVVKNSLTRIALKESDLEDLQAFVDGPTAIAFVRGDVVAATKKLVDAAKKFPVLELRGGWSEGRVLTAEDIRALAALESREQMLAKIAGLAKSQMSRTAQLLQALQSRFLGVLEAYKEKLPAGETEPPSEPAEEAAPAEEQPSDEEQTEGVADAAAGAEAGEAPGEEAAPSEGGAPEDGEKTQTDEEEGGS